MTASLAVITSDSFLPDRVEAELRLRTLEGTINPLAAGGLLERAIPGQATEIFEIRSGSTAFTSASALPTALPSPVGFVLRAPVESTLLELGLEVVDYGDGSDDRIEIHVAATGVSTEVAQTLSFDPERYSWRLSAVATMVGGVLKLSFELVQEEEPTEFVDAQASTQLGFVDDGSGPQLAVIKPKRPVVTAEASP